MNINDHMHVSRLVDCHPHSSASPSHRISPFTSVRVSEKKPASVTSVPGVRMPCGSAGKKKVRASQTYVNVRMGVKQSAHERIENVRRLCVGVGVWLKLTQRGHGWRSNLIN